MNRLSLSLCLLALLIAPKSWGFGEQHDFETLKLKGFSYEMNEPIQDMIDRQEGRPHRPFPSKRQAMWNNMLNSEWSGNTRPFTFNDIDPPRYQKLRY